MAGWLDHACCSICQLVSTLKKMLDIGHSVTNLTPLDSLVIIFVGSEPVDYTPIILPNNVFSHAVATWSQDTATVISAPRSFHQGISNHQVMIQPCHHG
jgi:hypothetical protein